MTPFRRAATFLLPLAAMLGACGSADPAATKERVDTARAGQARGGDLAITDAVVVLNANPAAPSAAYFTLVGGEVPATITGVQSADAERAELHESREEGGMMRMRPLADVQVGPGATVRFARGGKHVMLYGISDAARGAGVLTLSIAFADGSSRDVEARLVTATGEGAHAGH